MHSAALGGPTASCPIPPGGRRDTPASARDPSRLLRDLTDLFVSRRSPDGMAVLRYEDIACRLVASANSAARAYAAARISTHPYAPALLIEALLNSDPVCAKILAEHCARVAPKYLLQFAVHDDASYAAAVARRRKISPQLARVLAERTERAVLHELAANPQVVLGGDLLKQLVTKAKSDPGLARIITSRASDCILIAPLFLVASPKERQCIIRAAEHQNFPASAISGIKLVGPALVNWLGSRDPISSRQRIASELSHVICQPKETVEALLDDPGGEGLAILFAAAGMPLPEAIRFLLRCPAEISHSHKRLRRLAKTIEYLPAHVARWLIQAISESPNLADAQTPPSAAAQYQPLHDMRARQQATRNKETAPARPAQFNKRNTGGQRPGNSTLSG